MGYYGISCKSVCECAARKCNHVNGECLFDDSYILFDWDGSSGRNTSTDSDGPRPTDRIKAKHWIQIKGNGRMLMKNCTSDPAIACDWNNQDIPKLNSSQSAVDGVKGRGFDDKKGVRVPELGETHRPLSQNNTIIVSTLQSSIANLSDNIGELSKQVNEQRVELRRDRESNGNVSQHNNPNNHNKSVNSMSLPLNFDKLELAPEDAVEVTTDLDGYGSDEAVEGFSNQISSLKLEKIIATTSKPDDKEDNFPEFEVAGSDMAPQIVIRGKYDAVVEKKDDGDRNAKVKNEDVLHIITGIPTSHGTNTTKIVGEDVFN